MATSLDEYDRLTTAGPLDGGGGAGGSTTDGSGGAGGSSATSGAGPGGSAGAGGTGGAGPGGAGGAGAGGASGVGGSSGTGGAAGSAGAGASGGSAGTGGAGGSAGTGATGGSSGSGGCTQTQCGSDCADLSTDPDHCGQCNHDCDGGTCSGGECQPVLLSSGNGQTIYSVAVDATHLYFGSFGMPASIFRVPIGQPMATQTLVSTAHDAAYLVLTSTRAVWAGSDGLNSVPKAGGSETTLDADAVRKMPATDGTDVFYVDSSGDLKSVRATGGTPSTVMTGVSTSEGAGVARVGANDLYVVIETVKWRVIVVRNGTYFGGADIPGNPPRMVAADDTTVAVATTFGGLLAKSPPLIPPDEIVTGNHAAVAVYAGRVYYRDGSLRSVDADGNNAIVHASGVSSGPFGSSIAVDDRNVYYADGDSVYKVRR